MISSVSVRLSVCSHLLLFVLTVKLLPVCCALQALHSDREEAEGSEGAGQRAQLRHHRCKNPGEILAVAGLTLTCAVDLTLDLCLRALSGR